MSFFDSTLAVSSSRILRGTAMGRNLGFERVASGLNGASRSEQILENVKALEVSLPSAEEHERMAEVLG